MSAGGVCHYCGKWACVCDEADSIKSLKKELAELKTENNKLRYLVARFAPACIYCGLSDMAECKSGFPGCGKMDDINFETPELKEFADKIKGIV